jgi:hypothetical protein
VIGYPYYDRVGDVISYEQYKRLKADDEYRRVGLTDFPGGYVATSWMGSGPGGGDPRLIFETLVYGGPLNLLGDRYATEGEAAAGHDRWVVKVRDALAREAVADASRPPLVLPRAMWRELQEMHSPTTVSDGSLLVSGPCAVCKDPGEGNWCATYQWLVRVVTAQVEMRQEADDVHAD